MTNDTKMGLNIEMTMQGQMNIFYNEPNKTTILNMDYLSKAVDERMKRESGTAPVPSYSGSTFFCPECSQKLDFMDRFCRHCGTAIGWENLEAKI